MEMALSAKRKKHVFKSKDGKKISIYLTDNIGYIDDYIKELRAFDQADEDTYIDIYIGSDGGDLDTTTAFIEHIRHSKATVTAYVSYAASAATLIALVCDRVYIYEKGWFMIHNFSAVSEGKGYELKVRAAFEEEWTKDIFKDVYYPFLSEEEIENVVNDKDMWLLSKEVKSRLINIGIWYDPYSE
jgi:ATP-dependent protease ClpP protease subunit